MATDLDGSTYSEVDASNTSASPNGWPDGITGTGAKNSGRMMMGASKRAFDRDHAGTWCTVGGTATAITLAYTTGPASYIQGQKFAFKTTSNSAAGGTTVNVSGISNKSLLKRTAGGLVAIGAGDWISGDIIEIEYDGTQLQLLTAPSGGGVQILGKAAAITAPTDTSENILHTITLPANALGANGIITFALLVICANTANAKTLRIRHSGIGGTIVGTIDISSTSHNYITGIMANQNSASSQRWEAVDTFNGPAQQFVSTDQTAAIDTTSATTIVITMQKGTGAESVVLRSSLWAIAANGL